MVVGLGNPGVAFQHTRHNAGFLVVDELARMLGASSWHTKHGALVAEVARDEDTLVLVKPTYYMNVVGGQVKKLASAYHVPLAGMLVIHDELELPDTVIAAKMGGGLAGHNGLRSLSDKFASRDFPRIRVGIGRPPGRMDPGDYVLQPLYGEGLEAFRVTLANAAEAARYAIEEGIDAAQQRYPAQHHG